MIPLLILIGITVCSFGAGYLAGGIRTTYLFVKDHHEDPAGLSAILDDCAREMFDR